MNPAYTIEIAKIVGTPGSGFWSQVHTFFPLEPEKKEKRGDLLAVLVVAQAGEGIEAVVAGREILGRLHEEYYGNLEGSAFLRLGKTVEKLVQENENLEIVAVCLVGQVLYLADYGEGKVVLRRGEKMGVVLEGAEKELRTGSGFLEEEDLVLLGSGHFFQIIGPGVMKTSLESSSLDEIVETLTPVILGRKNISDAAAILAWVKKEEEPPIKAVVVEEGNPPNRRDEGKRKETLFSKIFARLRLPQKRSFFVRRSSFVKKKKIIFLVSLAILAFLVLTLGLGMRKLLVEKREKKVRSLVALAEEKFNQGKTVFSDKQKEGRDLIEEAKKTSEEGLRLEKGNQELILLKEQMDKFLANMGTETVLAEAPVFMDLSLIADGASGVSFSLLDSNLVILDKVKHKLYLLDVGKKSYKVIEYPSSEGQMVSTGKEIFVFDGSGIFATSLQEKPVLKIKKDEAWNNIIELGTFGGNLYLLDKGGNIWRYLAFGENFSGRSSWFVGVPPDLSSAVSMAIDGSIWVLEKDKILKLTLGRQDNFSLSKMPASPQGGPESFSEPIKIYTNEDCQNLYVLDRGRKKVFVIGKDGVFQDSYGWEGIKDTNDVVAVESMKKIFLLSAAKIYEIGMK